jgi:hypothetical protein
MLAIFMYALASHILNDSHIDFKRHAGFPLFGFYGLEWLLFSHVNILIKNALNKKKSGAMIFAVRQPTSPEHKVKLRRNAWNDTAV